MREIDQTLKLYGLLAERCEKSGHAPRQARIYREISEFIQGCETAEDAAVKLKNSKYYLAPGAALCQDKLANLALAAKDNGMPAVAAVYENKIAEIDSDIQGMYETGYEQVAQSLKGQYSQTYQAFAKLHDCYLALAASVASDKGAIQEALRDLRQTLTRLVKPSADFSELAAMTSFRRLVPANDLGYTRFIQAVPILADQGADYAEEERRIQAEYEQAVSLLDSHKETIIAAGQANQKRTQLSQVLAVAPASKSGGYTYSDEEVRAVE